MYSCADVLNLKRGNYAACLRVENAGSRWCDDSWKISPEVLRTACSSTRVALSLGLNFWKKCHRHGCVCWKRHTCIISELRPLECRDTDSIRCECALDVDLPMRAPTLCVAGV